MSGTWICLQPERHHHHLLQCCQTLHFHQQLVELHNLLCDSETVQRRFEAKDFTTTGKIFLCFCSINISPVYVRRPSTGLSFRKTPQMRFRDYLREFQPTMISNFRRLYFYIIQICFTYHSKTVFIATSLQKYPKATMMDYW